MTESYGIRNTQTGQWFGGFGPAPEYKEIWVNEQQQACCVGTKQFCEAQAYLLERFAESKEVK